LLKSAEFTTKVTICPKASGKAVTDGPIEHLMKRRIPILLSGNNASVSVLPAQAQVKVADFITAIKPAR